MSAELELARLEKRVLAASGIGAFLKFVDRLRGVSGDRIAALILAMDVPRAEAQALAAVLDAYGLGADDALTILEQADAVPSIRIGRPPKWVKGIVKGLDKRGREAVETAKKLARAGAEPDAILAPVYAHANAVQARVLEGINGSGNAGATAVADAAGKPTVWVAETDACVHCLAYSGRVAKPGKPFPGGLTYGKRSYHPGPLPHPPLHPRCRCTVEPLNDPSYAAALRREADRSVLRGFSLASESMGVRVDAAARLVAKGVDAPASVIAFARRSIKAGKFPTRGRPARR